MTRAYRGQVRGFRMGGAVEGRRGIELETSELSLECIEMMNRLVV
jgi:hypothetical protein